MGAIADPTSFMNGEFDEIFSVLLTTLPSMQKTGMLDIDQWWVRELIKPRVSPIRSAPSLMAFLFVLFTTRRYLPIPWMLRTEHITEATAAKYAAVLNVLPEDAHQHVRNLFWRPRHSTMDEIDVNELCLCMARYVVRSFRGFTQQGGYYDVERMIHMAQDFIKMRGDDTWRNLGRDIRTSFLRRNYLRCRFHDTLTEITTALFDFCDSHHEKELRALIEITPVVPQEPPMLIDIGPLQNVQPSVSTCPVDGSPDYFQGADAAGNDDGDDSSETSEEEPEVEPPNELHNASEDDWIREDILLGPKANEQTVPSSTESRKHSLPLQIQDPPPPASEATIEMPALRWVQAVMQAIGLPAEKFKRIRLDEASRVHLPVETKNAFWDAYNKNM